MFLSGEELGNGLGDMCISAEERLVFVSPFVKRSSLEHFIKKVNPDSKIEKNLITTWNLSDIASGVSDLSVYPFARDHGWSVRLVEGLHAKVYVADHRALLGSANLTNSGFSLGSTSGNIETGTLLHVDQSMSAWLDDLFANSVLINDNLYSEASIELAAVEITKKI